MALRLILAAVVLLTIVAPGMASAQAGRRGDALDANTASEKQLRGVPGLTPELAKAIVDRPPFLTMTELDAAMGATLSREQRTGLYQRLFVQIDLNTASDEEILLIPGLGPRLLAEFKQYRPYRAIQQFRREIGKYVDAKEVSRLERYVTVN